MTVDQALALLNNATAQMNLPRAQHEQLVIALNTLKDACGVVKAASAGPQSL